MADGRMPCVICGHPMDGHRPQAVVCSGACRADLSRLRRILSGSPADGARSVAGLLERRQNRTDALGRVAGATLAGSQRR